jgi:8-oxo-dGTP diphosphatase
MIWRPLFGKAECTLRHSHDTATIHNLTYRSRLAYRRFPDRDVTMPRPPIEAAGGIVLRGGPTPLIAVVQRRKDRGWVLPKGKLARGESAIAAAKREVIEETGHEVVVHEFIGALHYETSSAPKIVQFWRMEAADAATRPLMKDIRAVEWLPLKDAVRRLSLPREQLFLRNIGPLAQSLARDPSLTPPTIAAAAATSPAAATPPRQTLLDMIRKGLRPLRLRWRDRAQPR